VQAQVFADDYVVESMRGLVRRINPLAKHPANPVLSPERPWEESFALPLTVMFDDEQNLYRMWYRPGYGKFNMGSIAVSHRSRLARGMRRSTAPLHGR
jgi:hypothetical protein